MERATVDLYETRGEEWVSLRQQAPRAGEARALGAAADDAPAPTGTDRWRVDLGCGAGRYLGDIGTPAVGIDAARTMLDAARRHHPRAALVQADLEALPLRHGSMAGAWAANSYLHLPSTRLPLALAELHWAVAVGAPVDLQVVHGPIEGHSTEGDIPGRYFSRVSAELLHDLFVGAGFDVTVEQGERDDKGFASVRALATRRRSLPDTVAPRMRLLTCGLNPSELAADAGVGFARPGNRFWPAALAAGLVSRDRDPRHALVEHGVGMTDLVKRATPRSSELTADEYVAGMGRVHRLVGWLRPAAVCFVGLEGYRAAVDRKATAGWQERDLGGAPVYVMPSTSGLNAHASLADLTEHLRAAAAGPRR